RSRRASYQDAGRVWRGLHGNFVLDSLFIRAIPILSDDRSRSSKEPSMKPPRFEYFAPRTVDEALRPLANHGDRAKILAGGQSLIPLLNFRLAHPEALIDINRIADLAYIRADDGGVVIGALARQYAVERSELIEARVPIVREACRLIGHLPIRHRGTVGGNLAHTHPPPV